MEQGSEPLLFDGDTYPLSLLPACPPLPRSHTPKPSCFPGAGRSPNPPQSAAARKYSQVPGSPPHPHPGFLSGVKRSPGRGQKHFTSPLDAVPACDSPGMLQGGGAGPKARSSSSPAAAGFCKTPTLRGSRAAGCLSCASPGDRTARHPRGRALLWWLSGNAASGKPCGRTCGRRRCGR